MDYRISTITCISKLSNEIDLKRLYSNLEINNSIKYIEYGVNNYKGWAKKLTKKSRKKFKKKTFFNQATIHLWYDKLINIKLFNNGNIQLTGINNKENIESIILKLIKELSDKDIIDSNTTIVNYKIVLINSDFDIGFKIDREKLYRYMLDKNIYCTYESCTYPGVNIKFYYNKSNALLNEGGELYYTGVCDCSTVCDGKSNGVVKCKKITIAVFKSGKIIITGAQTYEQLNIVYKFIKKILLDNYNIFKI